MAIAAIIEQYSLGNGSCVVFFDDDAAYLQGVIEYVTRVNLTQVRVRAACARDTRAHAVACTREMLACGRIIRPHAGLFTVCSRYKCSSGESVVWQCCEVLMGSGLGRVG
jgi:hypothetical protein